MKKDYQKLAEEFIEELQATVQSGIELQYKQGAYGFAQFLQSQEEKEEHKTCERHRQLMTQNLMERSENIYKSNAVLVVDEKSCEYCKSDMELEEPKEIKLIRLLGGGWADE